MSAKPPRGITTRALHTRPGKRDVHGALRVPVYDNAAFEAEHATELEQAFAGRRAAHVYSRTSNPTVEQYENTVNSLCGGLGTVAVATGMAAISTLVFAIGSHGRNIVCSNYLFGHTVALFRQSFERWGLEARFVSISDHAAVEAAIDANTIGIFFETISNPQLEIANLALLRQIAERHKVPLLADSTMTPPSIFDASAHGIAVQLISGTKYFSGGATSLGGLIVDQGRYDWRNHPVLTESAKRFGPHALIARLRNEAYRNTGPSLSPHSAWLQTLGLETLTLRVERSNHNALEIARFLKEQPGVSKVHYPGLEDSPYHKLCTEQFTSFGALLTFELESKEECYRFMDRLELVRRATNIHDNKSLIVHPGTTIFADYTIAEREAMGVNDRMLRLSVGIEDAEDLREDLATALTKENI